MRDLDPSPDAPLALEGLLPQRAPMILLTRALGLVDGDFVAEVDISPESAFFDGDGVPAWIGLEYMAQTVGALSGAEGRMTGAGVRPGLLLGAREYRCTRDRFLCGETLRVTARKVLLQDNGISAMECFIHDAQGTEIVQAQLTLVQLPDWAAFEEILKP